MKESEAVDAFDTEDIEGEGEDQTTPRKKKYSGKKLTLFIILPILLLGGGAAGAYFSGLAEHLLVISGLAGEASGEAAPKEVFYYDLPELLVNLDNGGKRKSHFLKLRVALEIEDPEVAIQLDNTLPRIIDNFQVYLRELRIEDLNGSAGLFRLREELLVRVNAAVQPIRIHDVLFTEMIVQ